MGWGECRFPECQDLPISDRPKTSVDHYVTMPEQGLKLVVCGLWEHYATEHNVLPPTRAREAVMAADAGMVTSKTTVWREPVPELEMLSIYFVEREEGGYNHRIGASPDRPFIDKLRQLILFRGSNVAYMGIR